MKTIRTFLFLVLVLAAAACSHDWPGFRHNLLRNGSQPNDTPLANPASVATLHVTHQFTPAGAQNFRASPVVWNGRVFIGNANGRLYALDATTLALLWQFPAAADPPLVSQFICNPSSRGLAASATIAKIGSTDAVIFGAPDQSLAPNFGSGRLFALNASTGAVIWKSPAIAALTGTTSTSTAQLHEQLGYSSPLVFGSRVYVGVANHCDNPIQNGRVVAVRLADGTIDGAFSFVATGTRGGGVWNSPAGLGSGIFFTTGNVRCWNGGCQGTAPSPNHTLSMVRVNSNTGAVEWELQPVPFSMDDDPDWAAGSTILLASCGTLSVSTMKDGWSYAVNVGDGTPGLLSVKWQFPPTGFPFTPGDGTSHGDTRYLRPGAGWGDLYVTMTGGWNVVANVNTGFRRLHALDACATSNFDRVRWILTVPDTSSTLGPPSVTRGIFYVGTDQGRLVVFADPSVSPAASTICSNPAVTVAACAGAGFKVVPVPAILANVTLGGQILTEPALARGRVYVASANGAASTLFLLQP
jgi:outer membrane protein assembly factor BamB